MTMGARDPNFDWRARARVGHNLSELRRHNLAAVFRSFREAEAAAAAVRKEGLKGILIVFQDRRLTDEGPAQPVVGSMPADAPVRREPVQTPTRTRDAEVVRVVLSRTMTWSAAAGVAGGAVGILVGLAFFGPHVGAWATLAAGAAAGSVFGAVAGGIWGSMNQARREEGCLLEIHTDDPAEARTVSRILERRRPLRLDQMTFDQRAGSA
jgi:hypothetical protein